VNDSLHCALSQAPETREALTAFQTATGLAVRLLPDNSHATVSRSVRSTNPLCAMIAQSPQGKTACRCFIEGLRDRLNRRPAPCALQCFAGLTELAMPVTVHGRRAALLICGPVFQRKPTWHDFDRVFRRLQQMQITVNRSRAGNAFSRTRVASRSQFQAATYLLDLLAKHLTESTAQQLINVQPGEADGVRHAKEFVQAHLTEAISMHQVAGHVGLSPQYFCRVFKASTTMTFTEYVCRLRLDKARELLADPARRISEVALAVGFNSIPYFDRAFHRYVGTSPKQYRATLHPARVPPPKA